MIEVVYDDAVFNLKGLSEYTNVPYTTLCWRIRNGWTAEEAVKGVRVHESVREFMAASNAEQYNDEVVGDVFRVYTRWCEKEWLTPLDDLKTFTKHMVNFGWNIRRTNGKTKLVATPKVS